MDNSKRGVKPKSTTTTTLVFTHLDSGQEGGQLRGRDHQLCDVLARLLLHPVVPVNIMLPMVIRIHIGYEIAFLHYLRKFW